MTYHYHVVFSVPAVNAAGDAHIGLGGPLNTVAAVQQAKEFIASQVGVEPERIIILNWLRLKGEE